jgi:hypothetical protein
MSRIPSFAVLILALTVAARADAGDESKPWSQIDLGTIKQSDPNQHKLELRAIDGRWESSPDSLDQMVPLYPLAPGPHRFIMATTKPGFRDRATYVEFGLELQPCMSYALVAVHRGGTSTNNLEWMPKVTAARPIKRCMKTFGIASPDATIPTPTP